MVREVLNQSYASLSQGPVLGHLAWVCPDLPGYDLTTFRTGVERFQSSMHI